MALYRTGGIILKSLKPGLINPGFIIPSSVTLQVRHAARKGYREAKRKKAAEAAQPPVVTKELQRLKRKYTKIERTPILDKPEPPNDDIIVSNMFNYKKYSIAEAVLFHKEYHHPEVYNSQCAPVSVKIELNMTAKKTTRFLKPFSGVASIPHPFIITHAREVLALCEPEHVQVALDAGASLAGGNEIIAKIKEGVVQPLLYDYVIVHTNFLSNLTPIRNQLKDHMPRAKLGTLTNDLASAINRFKNGIVYSCVKLDGQDDFGFIECNIGTVEMEAEQVEDNFKALVEDIEKLRPQREGDFISWVWCASRPSPEEFCIDLSRYLDSDFGKDSDDEDEQPEETEEEKVEQLKKLHFEKETMKL